MKTKHILSVMAMIVLATASLMANDPAPFFEIINLEGSSIYKLVYKAPGRGKVNLKITDKSGAALFSEVVNFTHGFTYPVDFKGMNQGEYFVEVSDKGNKLKQSLKYEVKSPSAYVHVAKRGDEKYMLTIASQVPANFTVRIYDRWNNEVFVKDESVAREFGLVYDLAQVEGPFTFDVVEATGKLNIVKR